jgi:hypothetical protein
MGYSTTFTGRIKIEPALSSEHKRDLDSELSKRHKDDYPTIWWDWKISSDRQYIEWNGSEKSYYMDEILRILIDKYFIPWGYVLQGRILSQGERKDDIYVIDCSRNIVIKSPVNLIKLLEITT